MLASQSDSESRELALGPRPLAFVGSLPPRSPAPLDQQKQELAQDQDPCPERVQPAVAHRVLKRDCGLSENEACKTTEETVCGDGRRGAALVGINNVCERGRIDPSVTGFVGQERKETKNGWMRFT